MLFKFSNLFLVLTFFYSLYPLSAKSQPCNVEKHSNIPNIYHLTYHEARQKLIENGWQPNLNHWSYQDNMNVKSGNAPIFWEQGYWEVESCSGSGYGFCRFIFTDVYLNTLVVITGGQEIPEDDIYAIVDKWFFLCDQNQ